MDFVGKSTPIPHSRNFDNLNKNSIFKFHIFIVIVRHQKKMVGLRLWLYIILY